MQLIKWVDNPKKVERIEKKLMHYMGKAIGDFNLIQNNDRILVCVSGGKDSITMVKLLHLIRKRTKVNFELMAFVLDQAQPGWNDVKLREFFEVNHIPYKIMTQDTYTIVKDKVPEGKTYCSLCSRLRRGIIYTYASEHGYNKIALGHHRDDLITSLLMSIFYNGEVRTMPPKLLSDDQKQIVIRPLAYCQEKDIAEYASLKKFPIIPCNLCGSQDNLARKKVKRLIESLASENPKIPSNMLSALQQIKPSQLMDKKLWDFKKLEEKQQHGRNRSEVDRATSEAFTV